MHSIRLHGARDLRFDELDSPMAPGSGEVLLRVGAVGICGSDLHMIADGRIGDTIFSSPLVLGHEFMGVVAAVGADASDGENHPLTAGQRVAVDPAVPCWRCEICEYGHPNLCPNHTFMGVYPSDGALREYMVVPARNCFPLPDSISAGGGALLETLGVAIHAVDLGHVRVGETAAVIGCGPVGLLICKLLKLSGLEVTAFDPLSWRAEKARDWGVDHVYPGGENAPQELLAQTNGRGVDVVFEAAWADATIQQSMDMARCGGRVVLVGIPGDDRCVMKHSTARRKGLTLAFSRRMKHTYPRAIKLAASQQIDLDDLVSACYPLNKALEAFEANMRYDEGVHKLVISVAD